MLTMEILQLPALRTFLSGEHPAAEISQFPSAKIKIEVTLRLVVYHQSFLLGVKHLATHDILSDYKMGRSLMNMFGHSS